MKDNKPKTALYGVVIFVILIVVSVSASISGVSKAKGLDIGTEMYVPTVIEPDWNGLFNQKVQFAQVSQASGNKIKTQADMNAFAENSPHWTKPTVQFNNSPIWNIQFEYNSLIYTCQGYYILSWTGNYNAHCEYDTIKEVL